MSNSHLPVRPLSYRGRVSALETARVYELVDDTFWIRPEAKRSDQPEPAPLAIPVSSIRQLRLRHMPTRVQANRYECIVKTDTGAEHKLSNEFYRGIMQFEDRSAEYVSFVSEFSRRLADANPQIHFARGVTGTSYYISMTFATAAFALLAIVIMLLGPVFSWITLVELGIVALFLPSLIRWARKNRPKSFDPRAIPPEILPPAR